MKSRMSAAWISCRLKILLTTLIWSWCPSISMTHGLSRLGSRGPVAGAASLRM
jgi:hypothetical protein